MNAIAKINRQPTETTMAQPYIGNDYWGWFVEFYRDDDNNSGCGDNAQTVRLYGTRNECFALAKKSPPKTGWRSIGDETDNPAPGSAAWCETCADNFQG